jgi:hypothetical protein
MSSSTDSSAVLYSPAERSFSIRTSSWPLIEVRGVLSSCDALAIKFFCIAKEVSRRSSILLNVFASLPISSVPLPSETLRFRLVIEMSSTSLTTSEIGLRAFPE